MATAGLATYNNYLYLELKRRARVLNWLDTTHARAGWQSGGRADAGARAVDGCSMAGAARYVQPVPAYSWDQAMHALSQDQEAALDAELGGDTVDMRLVASMRMMLALSVLLFHMIDSSGATTLNVMTWSVLSLYALYSAMVYGDLLRKNPLFQGRLVHWVDIAWYALIIVCSHGANGYFYLFFFFAILTCSFRWGFAEGARLIFGAMLLFVLAGALTGESLDLPRILVRGTFLLALGYIASRWGQSKVELKRRMALVRDVSKLSNPRFGADHTIGTVLDKTRVFFGGSSCMLLMRNNETGALTLRTIRGTAPSSLKGESIATAVAAPLLALPSGLILVDARPFWRRLALRRGHAEQDNARNKWNRLDPQQCGRLAELLDARSFISAPVFMRNEEGRVYVLSRQSSFNKADAVFLGHIALQAFAVIENIEVLDHVASDAASQERRRLALDLHDTAIQPYIGLKMGLRALRARAEDDNPLVGDLDKLLAMATQVIGDLRRYAGSIRNCGECTGSLLQAEVQQLVAQMRQFYGIEIAVGMDGELHFGDRLSAELVQVVREGLSNIRKHTLATSGGINFQRDGSWVKIRIENDGVGKHDFTPRSITERVMALGGNTHAVRGVRGMTVVYIEIPI